MSAKDGPFAKDGPTSKDGPTTKDAAGKTDASTAWRPVIVGPWRTLFEPTVPGPGRYMNDHTVVKGGDGKWHIIGINGGGNGTEHSFAHAIADSIDPPTNVVQQPAIAKYFDGRPLDAWAPHAFVTNGTTYLFFRSNAGFALDVSTDPALKKWQRRTDITTDRVDPCYRDPMVIALGGRYVMYATAGVNGRSAIFAYESTDLIHWKAKGPALTTSGPVSNPTWCSTESPFVFEQGGYYHLSATITATNDDANDYHNTIIVRSTDPLNFGDYNGGTKTSTGNPVTKLVAHAPEIIRDDATGKWFITTCGWENRSLFPEAKHGVAIAELTFQP